MKYQDEVFFTVFEKVVDEYCDHHKIDHLELLAGITSMFYAYTLTLNTFKSGRRGHQKLMDQWSEDDIDLVTKYRDILLIIMDVQKRLVEEMRRKN